MGLIHEFIEFLKEYKVIALAIAFIIGAAATALVKSLVDNLLMPLIAPLMGSGEWREAMLVLGPVKLGVGAFVGELINFIIVAFVVFMLAKMVLKEEKVTKK